MHCKGLGCTVASCNGLSSNIEWNPTQWSNGQSEADEPRARHLKTPPPHEWRHDDGITIQVVAEGGAAALYRGLDTTVTRAAILNGTKMATCV